MNPNDIDINGDGKGANDKSIDWYSIFAINTLWNEFLEAYYSAGDE